MSPRTNFHAPRTSLSGEKFVVGGWWWVVVCKPILVFSFDFGQAEQKGGCLQKTNYLKLAELRIFL
jgi:hypothetical protein